jgi:hypothetical protein
MLTLVYSTGEYNCTVRIQGPRGLIEIQQLVWCPQNRQDLLEIYYWSAYAVVQGAYHCCFSIPGKVSLLPPNDPGCNVGQEHDKPHDGHFPTVM